MSPPASSDDVLSTTTLYVPLYARTVRCLASLRAGRDCRDGRTALLRYAALTYALLLVNSLGLLRAVEIHAGTTALYVAAVHLSYCAIYTLLAVAPALLLNELSRGTSVARNRSTRWASLGLALLGGSAIEFGLFADGVVFNMYGFHMNGFVWNLVSTPGGIESMGATSTTQASVAMLAVGFTVLQAIVLAFALRSVGSQARWARFLNRRTAIVILLSLIAFGLGERIAYGVSAFRAYHPILDAAGSVPFYTRARLRTACLRLGLVEVRDETVRMALESGRLNYPLQPITRAPDARDLNIVWLVAESWRGDTLTPEIMPKTTAMAARGQWFQNHYSAGNGTRMGMFGMFYGLYGPYWFKFLEANRGPVLVDTLLDANYDIDVRTSARFSYPEFDRTIWTRVPKSHMHEENPRLRPWENDRDNTQALIDSIETRDRSRPFMRFLFFESAHTPYDFPKESAVRRPFQRRLNYVTMDLDKDVELIRNRYLNSCHFLDDQFAKVFTYLDTHHLLDSTIVILTGDHGEEFMEKGHWGHHSTFVEEQVRPTLLMWMPGRSPGKFARLSSHLDIAPTVLTALGVTTPPSEYSLGRDLFGDQTRNLVVVADWQRLALIDEHYKIVAPIRNAAFGGGYVTTATDEPVRDTQRVYTTHRDQMLTVLRDLGQFSQ